MQTHPIRSHLLPEIIPEAHLPRTEQKADSVIRLMIVYTISIAIIIISIGTAYRIAHPVTDVSFNLTKK
jgi:hypothetical protein